jgi:hypothetical protein
MDGTSQVAGAFAEISEHFFLGRLPVPVFAPWCRSRHGFLADPVCQQSTALCPAAHRIDDNPLMEMSGNNHRAPAEERLSLNRRTPQHLLRKARLPLSGMKMMPNR